MAKETHSYSFKGELDFYRGVIVEYAKRDGDEDKIFPLMELLKLSHGSQVTISWKGECEPPTTDEMPVEIDEEI